MSLDTFRLAALRADRDALARVLQEAGCKINGVVVRCGFHDDAKPSGSIFRSSDGSYRFRCHGCGAAGDALDLLQRIRGISFVEAVAALGGGNGNRPRRPAVAKSTPVFPTLDDALASLVRQHGPTAGQWTYHNAAGEPVGVVIRWDRSGGQKDIRPLARVAGGWIIGTMPAKRPLYRLPGLAGAKRVYVVEGEKCADALCEIGLVATTSAGGSAAAKMTDWRPLAEKEVVLFPDADNPGRKYAQDVIDLLGKLTPRPMVKVVELPGLPEHGDIVDFIEARDCRTAEEIRAEVEALAAAVAPERGADGVPIEDLLGELMQAVHEGRPAVPSLKTGIELLDQAGGLACGEYMALFGPPGVGKSLLADAIALGVLDETPEATVLVFSLETAPIVRVARLACGRSVTFSTMGSSVDRCVPLRPTLDGKLEPYTVERLAATAAGLIEKYKGRLRFVDDATTASEIACRIQAFRPALVLVDHVGLLTPESENATHALDVGLGRLQDALREVKAAGVFIAETDKMSLKAASFGLASIRGSARVASLGGMVAVLAPDDDALDGLDPGLRFQLLKARHGRAWVEQTGSLLGGLGLVWLSPGVKPISRRKRRMKRADD